MLARTALLLACLAAIVAAPRAAAPPEGLFEFRSSPWLNLHHLLWARGERVPPPADMPDAERASWNEGIAAYAPYSKRALLFDEELLKIKDALRTVETETTLDGVAIDPSTRATLERLMPIYRKHWWPAHDRANREWIAAARTLVDRYGPAIDAAIARAYQV